MSTKESKARDAICALGAKLAARGLCPGTSGNISVRVDDGWLMSPTNSSLGELDPGVPWTASVGARPMLLALKSGNFGAPDFFTKAFQRL